MTIGAEAQLRAVLTARIVDPPALFGVAVSGGGDSMALLHLAATTFPGRVHAVTVDHGLRAESAAEAAGVSAFCAAHAIPHETLPWMGPKSSGNLMDQARQARLSLMADWARGRGICDVLLGHTLDDQAESFVMNLGRAAGLEGLCGMRTTWQQHAIRWHRPLLAVHRGALRAYLTTHGIAWVDDPSNDNPRFTRARTRKALAVLEGLGITAETLGQTMQHLQSAREALWASLADFAAQHVTETLGAVHLPHPAFLSLPSDLRRLFLHAVLRWMGGEPHAPTAPALAHFQAAAEGGMAATLAGTRLICRKSTLNLIREPRAAQGPQPFGTVWDNRWHITGPMAPGLEIRALGGVGLRLCPDWRDHGPRDTLLVTPSIWAGDTLIAAPLAGNPGQYRAELTQGLIQFILSH